MPVMEYTKGEVQELINAVSHNLLLWNIHANNGQT